MLKVLQINPVIYTPTESPGYYQDLGIWYYRYTDEYGRMVVLEYNPYTAQWRPLAADFWAKYEETAPLSKVLEVWPDDTIRINYSFRHKGPADSFTIEAGNCGDLAGDKHYDKGSRNTAPKSVNTDLSNILYSGYVNVPLSATWGVFKYKHIYFLITGADEEFVMRNALNPHTEAVFSDLSITNWSKVS